MAFVHDFLDIPVGFDAATHALGGAEPDWLAALANHGMAAGGELRLRVVPPGAAIPLPGKRGRVDVEHPYQRGDAWVLPFHWRAIGAAALFPQLEAELQVAPLGDGEVRLSLSGNYRPPLGEVGHVADTVLLHRLAERSMRVFLTTLADGLLTVSHAPDVTSPGLPG